MLQRTDEKKRSPLPTETIVIIVVIVALALLARFIPAGESFKSWFNIIINGVVILVAVLVLYSIFFGKKGKLKAAMLSSVGNEQPAASTSTTINTEIHNLETLNNLSLIFTTIGERMKTMTREEFAIIFKDSEHGPDFFWNRYQSTSNFTDFFLFIDKSNRILLLDYLLNKK